MKTKKRAVWFTEGKGTIVYENGEHQVIRIGWVRYLVIVPSCGNIILKKGLKNRCIKEADKSQKQLQILYDNIALTEAAIAEYERL